MENNNLENLLEFPNEGIIEKNTTLKRVIILNKFNSQIDLTGNDPRAIFVSQEDLEQIDPINGNKCFDIEKNCVIDYDNTQNKELERLQELRALREPLLLAFDKYKLNVFYGIEFEDEKQVDEILYWYKQIKELNENYITDKELIPKRIKYYL